MCDSQIDYWLYRITTQRKNKKLLDCISLFVWLSFSFYIRDREWNNFFAGPFHPGGFQVRRKKSIIEKNAQLYSYLRVGIYSTRLHLDTIKAGESCTDVHIPSRSNIWYWTAIQWLCCTRACLRKKISGAWVLRYTQSCYMEHRVTTLAIITRVRVAPRVVYRKAQRFPSSL